MSIWIIEPHEPLIFRDGRPFKASPGVIARSLPFPFPSTIAGGVRSQVGSDDQGHFRSTTEQLKRLKALGVRGPLLVQLDTNGQEHEQWFAPAPLDALLSPYEKQNAKFAVNQLAPLTPLAGAMSDFTTEETGQPKLSLVGLSNHRSEKPSKNVPAYWYWEKFLSWLANPGADTWKAITAQELGIKGPVMEERVHVAMDQDTRTGRDGLLFATSGLEFTGLHKTAYQEREQRSVSLSHARQLGLAVFVDGVNEAESLQLRVGSGHLGGEKRLVTWFQSQQQEPSCPDGIKQRILDDGACRLVLLTPAYFAQGYRPHWIQTTRNGVTPTLKAIVNGRPHVVSGWDIVENKPKQSRRLAPAGTVLFLTLDGDKADRELWIEQTWLRCISDDESGATPEQYRLDGFGLAALGTWTGEPVAMQSDSKQKEVL